MTILSVMKIKYSIYKIQDQNSVFSGSSILDCPSAFFNVYFQQPTHKV